MLQLLCMKVPVTASEHRSSAVSVNVAGGTDSEAARASAEAAQAEQPRAQLRRAEEGLQQAKQAFLRGLGLDALMALSESPACLADAQFHQLCVDSMILLSSTPCWAAGARA